MTFTLPWSLHETPHQHIVLTCFAENASTSWSTFSWHSGLVASKYVAKDSVLVVVSYPAIRNKKAWPAISSSVNIFWTFSDGVLPARGALFCLEVMDGPITSEHSAARESAELRESSIHWRKSLRLCRIQEEKTHKESVTEQCFYPWGIERESCFLSICPLSSHRMTTSISPSEETSINQLEMPSLRAGHWFLPSGMRLICLQHTTGTYFHRGLQMASSIQNFFHPQGEFFALAASKVIDTLNAQSHVHPPSGSGTTHAWKSLPVSLKAPSSFVHMVKTWKSPYRFRVASTILSVSA